MMRTVFLRHGLIAGMMLAMGAVACKSIGEDTSRQSEADLSGIYDDKYLLRLAAVGMSTDEKQGSYRFELCYASGESCIGAFEDSEGEDVLIDLAMVDVLDFDPVEYKELVKQVEDYYDLKIGEYDDKVFAYLTIKGAGSLLHGLGLATMASPIAGFIIYRRFNVKSYWQAIAAVIGGAVLISAGDRIYHNGDDGRKHFIKSRDNAKGYKTRTMDAHAALPKYLHMTNGILSTDPDHHVPVVGDDSVSVLDMTAALAKHLNSTFNQYKQSPGNVVDSVCYMKRTGAKVCQVLGPAH